MKKYINKVFLLIIISVFSLLSCDDYFDNAPDNIKTMEQVFQRKNTTEQFLADVYSYIRPMYEWSNQTLWTGISDELDVTYADYEISKINLGLLASDKEDLFYGNLWQPYYKGIRAATYFMQNVDKCTEMRTISDGVVTEDLRPMRKLEARALRAWFYFSLIRQYGPVVILPEKLSSADAATAEYMHPRSSIKTCFDYVVSELDSVIYLNDQIKVSEDQKVNNKCKLRDLPGSEESDDINYGRINIATCKAIKARALMYAASDFYNRDRTLQIFRDFKNSDGTDMFDYTDADRTQRWEKAAAATAELFNYANLKLYKDPTGDAYKSYKTLFMDPWASGEVIYAKPKGNFWEMDKACSPFPNNGGWSGWGATQELVDAYFTATGYPLLKDAGGNYYAADGSYTETGFSAASGDKGYTQKGTYNMYTNREPRFYASITFSNSKWIANNNTNTVQLYYGGNSGRTDVNTRNYSQTGYLAKKLVNPASNVSTGTTVDRPAIYFRLGEFYLNYAEILNEISYSANKDRVVDYLNRIRDRAGIPGYGNTAGMVPVPSSYEEMREAIRRERRVELAFEETRYFDCVRWAIAQDVFNGPKHGMNANDSRGESAFYQRTVFETRQYKDYNLLWPIPQSDIYKAGSVLVQNPKWSSITSSSVDK